MALNLKIKSELFQYQEMSMLSNAKRFPEILCVGSFLTNEFVSYQIVMEKWDSNPPLTTVSKVKLVFTFFEIGNN